MYSEQRSLYSWGGDDYDDYYCYSDYDMSGEDDDDDNDSIFDCSEVFTIQKPRDTSFAESEKLKEFLQSGIFSDISVQLKDKTYKLHRVVLSLKSAYFQKLFAKNFLEHKQSEVELRIVEIPTFDCIVKYMYDNDLQSSITSENMTKLLIDLDYLQIEVNLLWFSQFIQNTENIATTHLFELFNFLISPPRYAWLLSALLKYFSKNLLKISQCEYFCTIPFEHLKKILLSKEISRISDDEDDERRNITKICAKWICYDIAKRSSKMVELVNAVKYRYSEMFFLINKTLNISYPECDNNEKYVERKLEELLNYSVEFIPGSCSDWLNMQCEDSLIAPKNTVNYKQQMQEFLLTGDLSDVIVTVGNKTFQLHRVVLASKSTYFYNLFTENDSQNLKKFEIEEIDEQTFALILNYMYYEELEITPQQNIVSLMTASDRFELSGIIYHFENYVLDKVTEMSNIFELFSYLRRSPHDKMLEYVKKYILDNWSKIPDMPNFASISVDMLKDILSLSNVFAQEETDITEICTKWITHDYQNRLQYLVSLLPSISRTAVNVTNDVKIDQVKNNSPEVTIQNNLKRLLAVFNPISTIEPENNSSEFEKPFFVASNLNQINFLACNDFKSLNEMKELRQMLPNPSNAITSACAAVVKDNLFVHFNEKLFYAQNLNTKRCVSLTSDELKTSRWSSQLLNCNENVFLCNNQDSKVLKFSTSLNRWLILPGINLPTKKTSTSSIFTSNGKALYAISTDRQENSYNVQFYDERTKFWQSLPDVKDLNRTYDYPISACFTNQNLFVGFSSFAKTFNLRSRKWTTVYNSSAEYRHFFTIKPHKSHIFFVDKSKIHCYNIYTKNWDNELTYSNERPFQFLNIVHTI